MNPFTLWPTVFIGLCLCAIAAVGLSVAMNPDIWALVALADVPVVVLSATFFAAICFIGLTLHLHVKLNDGYDEYRPAMTRVAYSAFVLVALGVVHLIIERSLPELVLVGRLAAAEGTALIAALVVAIYSNASLWTTK